MRYYILNYYSTVTSYGDDFYVGHLKESLDAYFNKIDNGIKVETAELHDDAFLIPDVADADSMLCLRFSGECEDGTIKLTFIGVRSK